MNTVLVDSRKTQVDDAVRHSRLVAQARFNRLLGILKEWNRRYRSRARLRSELIVMDVARIEKDAGLTPGTLRREASRPFWKA